MTPNSKCLLKQHNVSISVFVCMCASVCMCFSGLFCESSPPMVLPRTSPCDNHECLNGAQCVVMGTDPRCQCLHGYEGERCETLVSVNFVSRESYLQLPSDLLSPETNISLQVQLIVWFSTLQLCHVGPLSPPSW